MIGFAVCVGNEEVFAAHGAKSYRRVAEQDSPIATLIADSSIHAAYNEALVHFAAFDELEALVLMHEDVELGHFDFCTRIRQRLADPRIAVLGTIGAAGVDSLAWWRGEISGWAIEQRRGTLGSPGSSGEVDAVDGMLMVLSPWAVRNLRFDEAFTGFHGYDVDYCFGARAAGRTVVAADLGVVHHTKGGYGDGEAWDACDLQLRRKWSLPLLTPARQEDAGEDARDRIEATLQIVLEDDVEAACSDGRSRSQ